jgi:hypothetical protein
MLPSLIAFYSATRVLRGQRNTLHNSYRSNRHPTFEHGGYILAITTNRFVFPALNAAMISSASASASTCP